jgi:hypothetical protein
VSSQDISGLVWYGLAAALGFVAGAILAVAQWGVLRQFVPQAGWWILANACAWALGMALIFVGMSFVRANGLTASMHGETG